MNLICGNHYYMRGRDVIVQVMATNPDVIVRAVTGPFAGVLLDVSKEDLSIRKRDCNGNGAYGWYRIHSTMEPSDAS